MVRYGGLPADRFWEMEDARIDLGATDVSTLDTGRLLLISFATVYGNDWFLTPLEVPVGSLTTIERMLIRDVFERNHLLLRAGTMNRPGRCSRCTATTPTTGPRTSLLMMPCTQGHRGEPLEQIGLTRDELANLAWAIQHPITDDRGEPVRLAAPGGCGSIRLPWRRPHRAGLPRAHHVPDYWFPLVPVLEKPGVIHFRLATMNGPGALPPWRPAGRRLITPGLWLHEEEVPREGAAVLRRPVLARWFDGSWHSWVRREKGPAGGESSSGLAFDIVRPTDPWP